jgi:hypothetical protein
MRAIVRALLLALAVLALPARGWASIGMVNQTAAGREPEDSHGVACSCGERL